jgi:hypothetical protein
MWHNVIRTHSLISSSFHQFGGLFSLPFLMLFLVCCGPQLRGRYPKLHVYAYGVLPCIDAVTAEACKSFVTRYKSFFNFATCFSGMRSFVFISWWIDRISLLYHLFVHS